MFSVANARVQRKLNLCLFLQQDCMCDSALRLVNRTLIHQLSGLESLLVSYCIATRGDPCSAGVTYFEISTDQYHSLFYYIISVDLIPTGLQSNSYTVLATHTYQIELVASLCLFSFLIVMRMVGKSTY